MNEMFGVSMTLIATICVILTLVIFVIVGGVAIRNPVMFKMGLRNIPRRPAQTIIILLGLMLSTVIMTAAFGTGDTLTRSITAEVYGILDQGDEIIQYNTDDNPAPEDQQVIPIEQVDAWQKQFANDPDIEAFLPLISERLPIVDNRTKLSEAQPNIVGYRQQDTEFFGNLRDVDGKAVELTGEQIAVNKELADKLDAKVGDTLTAYYAEKPVQLTVVAIVPNTLLSGTFNTMAREGGAVSFETLGQITGRTDAFDVVFVSNKGDAREGLKHSDAAMAKLDTALKGTPYKADSVKQDGVDTAELVGNGFTSIFLVMGLFSIAAGVLLIFLIFVMLAAERKPEMGMARAVGAKRSQIVESFLAEGLGYDFGSAIVGLAAGIGVVFAMVGFIRAIGGDDLGLHLEVHFSVRSLLTAFCLGVITTFIVITLASIRASRLNITAAIRDLPDSRAVNPEQATARGYLRAILNASVGFGILILSLLFAIRFAGPLSSLFLLAALLGLAGPWITMLHGSNFGRSSNERLEGEGFPKWPLILGVVLLPLILGLFILVGYGIALLVVRFLRDRRPKSMPLWMVFVGIIFAPVGIYLVATQDRNRQVSWSAGFGTIAAAAGVLMIQWGLVRNNYFLFSGGLALIVLWVAVTLRYFQIAERLSFTLTAAFMLATWFILPTGKLDWLTGELNGGFELFFLSGVVMVTSGTFIVVYNADILLPIVAAFGERFGRIVPAVKTAVAYPLTSRFRTGMTVAMIGLIMFAIIMFSTINANFSKIYLGDDSKGGFDDRVLVNNNNLIDPSNFNQDLQKGGVDTSQIQTVAEVRVAYPFEAQVLDPDPEKDDDTEFDRFTILGVDDMFAQQTALQFKHRAAGYETDRSVWDALRGDGNFAVVPASAFQAGGGFGPAAADDLLVLKEEPDDGFQPFTLNVRNPATGDTQTVTIIGEMKENADIFYSGIILRKADVTALFPDAKGQQYFLTLKPGADSDAMAKSVEAALVQAQADSLDDLIADQQRISNGFLKVFQGFMGLGLLVGIAALGVIAFRAVVERRQQIGMLRAIGYQRSMVLLSFLFESSFISLSGIVMGSVLAVALSWVLFASGQMADGVDVSFTVPWIQLTGICLIAFVASMVMTIIPARNASRVPVAEALRYE